MNNFHKNHFESRAKVREASGPTRTTQMSWHLSQTLVFGQAAFNGLKMPSLSLPFCLRMEVKETQDLILRVHMVPKIKANFFNTTNVDLMQISVSCYTTKLAQLWLSKMLKYWPKNVRTPHSPRP